MFSIDRVKPDEMTIGFLTAAPMILLSPVLKLSSQKIKAFKYIISNRSKLSKGQPVATSPAQARFLEKI